MKYIVVVGQLVLSPNHLLDFIHCNCKEGLHVENNNSTYVYTRKSKTISVIRARFRDFPVNSIKESASDAYGSGNNRKEVSQLKILIVASEAGPDADL